MVCEEMQVAARSVSKYCDDLRKLLNIPHTMELRYVPQGEIENKKQRIFKAFISNHPAPSWRLFAHALYQLGEYEALRALYNKHLPCKSTLSQSPS